MKKVFLLFFLMLLGLCPALAQGNITVKGTVLDKENEEPLIGVTVLVKGTNKGTATDIDGNFSMSGLKKGQTLVFSSVGMQSYTYVVGKTETIKVEMQQSVTNLDDVVVIGYGSSRKRDVTGSITSIGGEDLKLVPTYNPVNALQGKVPSLMVTNSGSAGGGSMINPCPDGLFNGNDYPTYPSGGYHAGRDISCPIGTPIYAAADGVVIHINDQAATYGNHIMIAHGNQVYTLYAHCSELLVAVGDNVTQGQLIALSGNTGNVTGPHLHFEVRVGGSRYRVNNVDPLEWILQ